MKTELLRLTSEDGLILHGIIHRPDMAAKKAFAYVHGMTGNFYENKFTDVTAEKLVQNGCAYISVNNRGHDVIAHFLVVGPKETYKQIGDASEVFSECVLDIKPVVDYLEEQGYEEVVLCGHSLGAVKAAYYVGKTNDKRVKKLVLMSPPDMVGLAEIEKYHTTLLEQAHQMVGEGRGEELLPQKIWDWSFLSAKTYIELSARDYPVDVFNTYDPAKPSLLSEIRIPTLAVFGENDDAAIMPLQQALDILKAKTPNAPRFDTAIIPGASHIYFGKEEKLAQSVSDWLK